ncbi:MAG: hypothetical protein ACJ77K_06440 [Bacteroidia bacterium]
MAEQRSTNDLPVLYWEGTSNPVVGKLRLKSLERTSIFYEEWVHYVPLNAGMPDFGVGPHAHTPLTLVKIKKPKKVDVPVETTIVQGFFESKSAGKGKANISLVVKIMIWVETDEDAEGIEFDFQKQEQE